MCGIMGIVKHKGSKVESEFLMRFSRNLLDIMKVRGRDATGFGAIWDRKENMEILVAKEGMDSGSFYQVPQWGLLKKDFPDFFIGHVRMGTGGKPEFNRNNHPFYSDDGKIMLVHNGVVAGFPTKDTVGDCDTERMLRMVEREEDVDGGIKEWFTHKTGSFAVLLIDATDEEDARLKVVKDDGRPLVLFVDAVRKFSVYCSEWELIRKTYLEMGIEIEKEFEEWSKRAAERKGEEYKKLSPALKILPDSIYHHRVGKIKPLLKESCFQNKWAFGRGNADKAEEERKKRIVTGYNTSAETKTNYPNRNVIVPYSQGAYDPTKAVDIGENHINKYALRGRLKDRLTPGTVVAVNGKPVIIEGMKYTKAVGFQFFANKEWHHVSEITELITSPNLFYPKTFGNGYYPFTFGWDAFGKNLMITEISNEKVVTTEGVFSGKDLSDEIPPLPVDIAYFNLFRVGDVVSYGSKLKTAFISELDWNPNLKKAEAVVVDKVPSIRPTMYFYPDKFVDNLPGVNKIRISLTEIKRVKGVIDWTNENSDFFLGQKGITASNVGKIVTKLRFSHIWGRESDYRTYGGEISSFKEDSMGEIASDYYYLPGLLEFKAREHEKREQKSEEKKGA